MLLHSEPNWASCVFGFGKVLVGSHQQVESLVQKCFERIDSMLSDTLPRHSGINWKAYNEACKMWEHLSATKGLKSS